MKSTKRRPVKKNLPDVTTHYKATTFKTEWCWNRNRHIGMRIESPEIIQIYMTYFCISVPWKIKFLVITRIYVT